MKTNKKEHWQSLYCVTNKILYGASCHWVSFMLIWLVACPNYGQELPKKSVTEKEYHLWGTLLTDKISDNGKWVSYAMHYDDSPDTLFVKSSDAKKMYSFPKNSSGLFCGEQMYACLDYLGTLNLIDLDNGISIKIENVEQYSFSGNNKYLITLERVANEKVLNMRDLKGKVQESIAGINSYKQSNLGNTVACSYNEREKSRVVVVHLNKVITKRTITEDTQIAFSQLVWSTDDNALAFLKEKKNLETGRRHSGIYYYSVTNNKLFYFEENKVKDFPANFNLETSTASGLTISNDNKRVFFTIRKDEVIAKTFNGIQIWNGNDAVVYPERQHTGDEEFNTRIAVWWPEQDKFLQITDEQKTFGFLNGDKNFALTYGITDLEPQYKLNRNVNYYVTNLETGKKDLLVENQSTELFESSLSPNGKYFAYFKNNDWWIYNFLANKHTNVSKGLKLQLINNEELGGKEIYGIAGWGVNDEYLLLYDQYDIWKISFEGAEPIRLTKGHERKIAYRIVGLKDKLHSNFDGHDDPTVDISEKMLLKGTKGNETGYFFRYPNGNIKTIIFNDFLNNGLVKAAKKDVVVFQSQKYNSPPELIVCTENTKKVKLFQSNKHHYNFAWSKQEIISYKNAKNKLLQGVLYYPSEYNPNKQYPMIVHIYEKQLYLSNYYFNPSVYNMAGFNVANLTAQGYFVLLPDIEYELGNPGLSATDCVMAATKQVIQKGVVDSNKIGLIGHSFGGYETNFIIGQTNLFACAISGASVADLVGWYLSIGWVAGRPEIWRNESQQWRMGKSLFEDRKGYERNSPLTYVDKIETPVLIWTGEQDRQIHYYQSIALYLALRRLQKKEIMLVYPGEGHALLNKQHQKDFTSKMEDWLRYYLKEEPPKQWIREGVQ